MRINFWSVIAIVVVNIVLASCTNPKEKIVERQKYLKKQIDSIELQAQADVYKVLDISKEEDEENRRVLALPKAEKEAYFEKKINLEKQKIMPLIILKEEYDSLEIELKKY